MEHQHNYELTTVWTGNDGAGTKNVRTYDRSHTVSAISSCHMLSYLYLCAMDGIVVTAYTDKATGIMIEQATGGGSFKEVQLIPVVQVADESMIAKAIELHHRAHEICYIANSVNFEVRCEPIVNVLNNYE